MNVIPVEAGIQGTVSKRRKFTTKDAKDTKWQDDRNALTLRALRELRGDKSGSVILAFREKSSIGNDILFYNFEVI